MKIAYQLTPTTFPFSIIPNCACQLYLTSKKITKIIDNIGTNISVKTFLGAGKIGCLFLP